MKRWIVSFAALVVVSSAFAGPSNNNNYCPTTNNNCGPKPPTNCVPEPASVAALAIGGLFLLKRKKKTQ